MDTKIRPTKMHESWKKYLAKEFEKPYFKELASFIYAEYQHCVVYPISQNIFRAFELCLFNDVKVVILGQDPYHEPKQANGLCFAVGDGVRLPPSLQNIFKEIENDFGTSRIHKNGDLDSWARHGVLLLNSTLTVRAHIAGSHQDKGWEEFTDVVVRALSDRRDHLVFMLWGNYAKKKGVHIDRSKHLVLESVHPSPLSAYNGFFGCKHFSKANEYLKKHGKKEIDWI